MQLSVLVNIALLLGVSGQLCDGNTARVRKNILSLDANEWSRYVNAVHQLNSGPRPTQWDMYSNNHVQYFDAVHWNPWFLVWHRLYLHSVERALQTIDPGVTIPYWDWSRYAQNPQMDPVLSNRMFGGSGNRQSGCVSDGYFRDFVAYFWGNGARSNHCLIRSFNVFQRPFTSASVIDRNYLNEPTIASFAQAIEGVPHSTTHNNIGGEFSGHASPGDPLFYSHHAFIDKLWFDWQNRHPNQYYTYPLNVNLNVPPWNINVGVATDPIGQLCYQYPQEHFRYFSTSTPISSLRKSSYSPPVNASDDQLMAHARQFILKGIQTNLTIPDPLPMKMIRDMGYDLATIRNLERRDALTLAKFGSEI